MKEIKDELTVQYELKRYELRDFLISSDLLNNKEPQMNADFACNIRVYLRSSAVNRTD